MAKYYIQCGSLGMIYSTSQKPLQAAAQIIWETNGHDTLDEYFYIDERGYRNYTSADKDTTVIPIDKVIQEAGWETPM
jgi:hypothetical protein